MLIYKVLKFPTVEAGFCELRDWRCAAETRLILFYLSLRIDLSYLFEAKMSSVAQETVTSNVITLKGSTAIVKEFFDFSVNNILYQRGIYPPESFKRVSQYGLGMMVTPDESLVAYMTNILRQLGGKHMNS